MDHLLRVAQLALAATFLYAGGSKLFVPYRLGIALSTVTALEPGRRSLATRAARVIALAEVLTALLLVAPGPVGAGLVGAATLGAGIAVIAAAALVRRVRVDCGCFGANGGRQLGWSQLAFGAVVAVGATAAHGTLTGSAAMLAGVCLVVLCAAVVRHRTAVLRPLRRHFRPFTEMG